MVRLWVDQGLALILVEYDCFCAWFWLLVQRNPSVIRIFSIGVMNDARLVYLLRMIFVQIAIEAIVKPRYADAVRD